MKNIMPLMEKAQHSSLALWWFNRVMGWAIPFNQAHGFRVAAIGADSVTVAADYRRRNFNQSVEFMRVRLLPLANMLRG